MDDAISWRTRFTAHSAPADNESGGVTARSGGSSGDEPVLVAVLEGPVQAAMAQDALQQAGLPAYIKRNSLGPIYGLSIGSFAAAEVWTPPAVAEQAYDVLVGVGLVAPADESPS